MQIVNLRQRDPAWLQWRREGITATDASILLGTHPHKTPWRLWAEKTGYALPEDLSNNPHVQRGVELEDLARMTVETHWGDILLPVCVQSSISPILRASLDGLNANGEPVELKCPGQSTWEQVQVHGEASEAFRLYYPQVQHQINITGASKGWLVFFFEGAFKSFEIKRDDKLIQEIEAQADKFWKFVEKKKEPPKDPERDIFIPKGVSVANWIYEAQTYRMFEDKVQALKSEMDELRERQKASLENMKALMGDFYNADYCGVKITKYAANGRIDYKKVVEEKLPDLPSVELEQFRGEQEVRCRVSITESLTPKSIVDPEAVEPVKDLPIEVESFYW